MADLLAIVSHDPRASVGLEDLEALESTYESLRGAARRRQGAGGGRVRVSLLDNGADTAGSLPTDGGWNAWAGSLVGQPEQMARPLAELDGQFALIRVEGGGERVLIATDPLGMKPLFLAAAAGRTYVSSSALVLAKHLGTGPSPLGLESFLRSGLQFGRRTQWEGIERMRPAEVREFGDREPTSRTYWQPSLQPGVDGLSLAESADLCIERATEELGSRYRGRRPWVDLTGGFDSRLLSLLARRAGIDFIANTTGNEDDEDVRIARRIALAREWPWRRLDLPSDWTERMPMLLPEALAWGDGHLDALPLTAVLLGHREKSEVGTLLLNGGGGEEFRDHPWGHELLAAGRTSKVNYSRLLAWRILLPVDLSTLRVDPTAAVTAAFREELEERARPFAAMPNTFQGDLLYAFKMTGHSGAYQAAAGASIDLEVPFYLRPILLNVISVAPGRRRFHRLMRAMMHRLDPAVAALPTETGGPAEPPRLGNLHRFGPYAGRRAGRFAVRVRGKLPEFGGGEAAIAGPREAAQCALLRQLRAEGRLDPRTMRSAPLYDAARLGQLLDRAIAHPTAVDWPAVGRIVTVEMALEAAGAGLD